MVEIFILDPDETTHIRLQAARIAKMRRPITRTNALKQLDRDLVREATVAGLRRGAAFLHADRIMDAVCARLAELDRLATSPAGEIYRIERKSA